MTIYTETPKTLKDVWYKNGTTILSYEGTVKNIDLSGIFDYIINQAGRYCKHYASDILRDIDQIRDLVEHPSDDVIHALKNMHEPFTNFYFFGIREWGVDNADFIMGRLNQIKQRNVGKSFYLHNIYRKILAVRILIEPNTEENQIYVYADIKDLTGAAYILQDEDKTK